jgi:hypothetical protein
MRRDYHRKLGILYARPPLHLSKSKYTGDRSDAALRTHGLACKTSPSHQPGKLRVWVGLRCPILLGQRREGLGSCCLLSFLDPCLHHHRARHIRPWNAEHSSLGATWRAMKILYFQSKIQMRDKKHGWFVAIVDVIHSILCRDWRRMWRKPRHYS